MINVKAKEEGLSEKVIRGIEACRKSTEGIIEAMTETKDPNSLKEFFETWTNFQFKLQDLLGFDRDHMYHRSWYLPHCICAKMDNELIYPDGYHGGYWITKGCPIHN